MIDYFRFVMLNNVFGAGVWHFDQALLNGGAWEGRSYNMSGEKVGLKLSGVSC
jgi:hypothetical protein